MAKILIIDDNTFNAEVLLEIVSAIGHEVDCAATADEGRKALLAPYDVVFLDVQLPDGNGLALLPEFRSVPSAPEVIIITGYGSPDGAELAMKNGAWDFIEKPLQRSKIELPLARALQYREAKSLKTIPRVLARERIVGGSPRLESCLHLVAQAAASEAGVLITGETGTGKELFAQAIHENGPRRDRPFIVVDSASLPPTMIESILFGHERGAFTGADRQREGLIRAADGGTLFLDEVGDLPLPSQKTFLRVLQEHRFRPLGSKREYESDFRIISATNRDLDSLEEKGLFREDLLFRLRGIHIDLPPLRERKSDITELAFHYLHKICRRQRAAIKGFSPEMIETLTAYGWPGNVRELVNAMESAIATAADEPILYPQHLPIHIRIQLARNRAAVKPGIPSATESLPTLKEHRNAVYNREERQYLEKLLMTARGRIPEACRIAGLNKARLYQLIQKHRLEIPRFSGEQPEPGP